MARNLQMKRLAARKQALIAESEVYRQTLMLQVQNSRLYVLRVRRRYAMLGSLVKLAPLAGLLIGSSLRRRSARQKPRQKPRGRSLWRALLTGFRLYRSYGPLVQKLILQQMAARQMAAVQRAAAEAAATGPAAAESMEAQAPAANI